MNDEMNNNPENGEEKLFTQEEVNRIIGQRLAKVKTEVPAALEERERDVTQRELMLDTRAAFMDAGIDPEFLDIVKITSKEDIEKAVSVLSGYQKGQQGGGPDKWVRATSGTYRPPITSTRDNPSDIRRAMGLKG